MVAMALEFAAMKGRDEAGPFEAFPIQAVFGQTLWPIPCDPDEWETNASQQPSLATPSQVLRPTSTCTTTPNG